MDDGLSDQSDSIRLSVIVTVVGGRSFLRRCLSHLVPQTQRQLVEIIVPYDSTISEVEHLQTDFADVRFVFMGEVATSAPLRTQASEHELYDCRSSFGLRAAKGEVLALVQDCVIPASDWVEQVLSAHALPYGVVGGAVEHGAKRPLNWAVFFQDFGRHQPPLKEGPAVYLTDINVSYKRTALEAVKELWQNRYKEVTVNWALDRLGVTLWQRPQIVVTHSRGELEIVKLIIERYSWGRLFGVIRTREMALPSRLTYILLSPLIPLIVLFRTVKKAIRSNHRRHLVMAMPHLVVLTVVWCFGEFMGYLTGREASL